MFAANPGTVAALVNKACRIHRFRDAILEEDGRRTTYAQLEARAWRLANALTALGLTKGARVAVLSANCREYIEIDFAMARAGIVKVPLYAKNSAREHLYFLQDSGAKAIIGEAALLSEIDTAFGVASIPTIAFGDRVPQNFLDYEVLIQQAQDRPFNAGVTPSDPYQIRYTGGTTGVSKGALMSNAAMVVATMGNVFCNGFENAIQAGDVFAHIPPLSHVSGFNIAGASYVGVTHLPIRKWDPDHLLGLVARHRIGLMMLIPTMVTALVRETHRLTGNDLTSLKTITYGGEPMPPATLEKALSHFGPIFTNVYGSTEAPSLVAWLPKKDHIGDNCKALLGSCGFAAPWLEMQFQNETGAPLDAEETGELCIQGPMLFEGYVNKPEQTLAAFRNDWYLSGDIGYMDEQGYIYLKDRKSDMIISGGFNIYPAEVEAALSRFPGVVECVVVGLPDPVWGEAVTAVIRLETDLSVDTNTLKAHCEKLLTRYKIPKRFLFRQTPLPKSEVGKLLRRAVKAQLLQSP